MYTTDPIYAMREAYNRRLEIMLRLRERGLSQREIGRQFGISQGSVWHALKKHDQEMANEEPNV